MKHSLHPLFLALVTAIFAIANAQADYPLEWEAATTLNAGNNNFAPYFISSNREGTITQKFGIFESGRIWRSMNMKKRFDYGFGTELWVGAASKVDYMRYRPETLWMVNGQKPANIWLQQLYGEVKYRCLFLQVGLRSNNRSIFDSQLGVGDITMSNNARPITQLRIGMHDFQNVPFTKGWVQVQAELAYGKFADANWNENHYNRYNYFVTTGVWMHYKRAYFRTNPSRRFSATIGMQHAAQFGGVQTFYDKGVEKAQFKNNVNFGTFLDVFVQRRGKPAGTDGVETYYNGNHLGSWDVKLTYRFNNGSTLTASLQSPWEDGSGIGKLNGWDGVWALEYNTPSTQGWLTSAMASYIDFTNQSGPIHWAPGDKPGTTIPGQATGADDYYNNYAYNGWQNNGMAIGTPFIMSPIYNTDGYMRFAANRMRGFQIGFEGKPASCWDYRVLVAWRKSWGTPIVPFQSPRASTSAIIEASYKFTKTPGLWMKGQLAFDGGTLYGKRFGTCITLGYNGKIIL